MIRKLISYKGLKAIALFLILDFLSGSFFVWLFGYRQVEQFVNMLAPYLAVAYVLWIFLKKHSARAVETRQKRTDRKHPWSF